MQKVIVTGANGFVGYWLIKELMKHSIKVIAIVKDTNEKIDMLTSLSGVSIVYCNLSNMINLDTIIPDRGFDAFYHLAWISAGGSGRADYNLQLMNAKYACDAVIVAKKLNCKKILVAGTITEKIASQTLVLPVKSNNIIYGIAKHTTHCMLGILTNRLNLEFVWMQFSNLYGPYSINGNIVGYTIKEILEGRNAIFGTAQQPYDLLYIEDLVYAAYLLGEKDVKRTCYYLGSGNPKILKDYLIRIGELCGNPDAIKIGARADDGLKYDLEWFDASALIEDTGYMPRISFDQGVLNTINWMKL